MNIYNALSGITLVLLVFMCSPVSAYYLSLDAPAQVKVGEPILITGSTNTPPPDKIDVIFSLSLNVPVEIERQSIQITEKGDTTFNVTFKTEGLEKGNYKIEGLSQSQRDFSAGSRSLRVVKLIDRSDMIIFTSPTWQEFEKTLLIEAKISGHQDNAIQMEVKKENNSIFGPESIPVDRGLIKYELPITEPGPYEVTFADYDGFIGKYAITSEERDGHRPTGELEQVTAGATPIQTVVPETQAIQTSTTKPAKISGISASGDVSRDAPAYFIITADKTPLTFQTSDNTDWVIEYKTSPDGVKIKVNEEMGNIPETVTVKESVSDIYLKVYPYSYKAAEKVTITADTASSVALSDDAAKAFAAPPRYGTSAGQAGTKTPIPIGIILISLVIGLGIFIKRK